MAAEQGVDDAHRRRAVLVVAQHATDPEDCLELLDMLALQDLLPKGHIDPTANSSVTGRHQA